MQRVLAYTAPYDATNAATMSTTGSRTTNPTGARLDDWALRVEAEEHPPDDLVARHGEDDVLRHGVHVTPAAVEHRARGDRVHPGDVVQEVDRARREMHRHHRAGAVLGEHRVVEGLLG